MTPSEFRTWFGSSQVVDATGAPLLVFRGEHGATPVASLDEARSARTMARATEIIQGMDQQTYDTLQNDSVGNFWSGRKPLPSVLRESFQDWMSEYPGSEGETMMAHENLDETYARFIEDLLDAQVDHPGSYEPAVVAMAKAFRDGTGIQGLKQDSGFQTRLGSLSFGSAKAASMYAMEPNDRNDGQAHSPRVVPAYLQINNPLINTPEDCFIDLSRIRALRGEDEARRIATKFAGHIENTGLWQDEYAAAHPSIDQFIKSAAIEEIDALYFNVWAYLDDPDEVALLREAGIDGAIYGGSGANALEPEYRVFSDTQVQNAIEAHSPGRSAQQASPQAADSVAPDGTTDSPTEAPAFKAWFKDSKVVNADGKPRIMYHGTGKDFAKAKGVFWAADNPEFANTFVTGLYADSGHNIMPVYLAINNPIDFCSVNQKDWITKADIARMAGVSLERFNEALGKRGEKWGDTNPIQAWVALDDNGIVSALKKLGFDGVVWHEVLGRTNVSANTYATFSAAQIKSAIGNNGLFNPSKPDIRYSVQAEDALKAPAKSAQRSALGLYSELSEQIMTSTMKQAPASDWKYFIKGLDKKGVKSDEIKWSGVLDWLDLQKENGRVTQEALLTYLETNGVQVRETVIGDGRRPPLGWVGDWSEPDFNGESFVNSIEGWRLVRDSDGRIDIYEDDELIHEGIDGEGRAKALASESHYGDGDEQSKVTKFSQYVLPGATNYREVLLTLPRKNEAAAEKLADEIDREYRSRGNSDRYSELLAEQRILRASLKSETFKSGHWDQHNVLVHIRLNDRLDADGAKVLFVEELQSDWGQEGKKKGFNRKPDTTGWAVAEGPGDPASGPVWEVRDASGRWVLGVPRENAPTKEAAITRAAANRPGAVDPIPSAPFVGATDKWLTLALKRVIGLAVDGGYDKVAFVSGAQSSDRYKLSKQINAVSYNPGTGYYVAQQKDGGNNQIETDVTPEKLASLIGKAVANKLLATELNVNGVHVLRDIDLQTGGEGMQVFYDTIVPNTVSALLKKLDGGKMEPVPMAGAKTADQLAASVYGKGETYRNLPPEPQRRIDDLMHKQETEQPGFSITNSLRAKVTDGMPLFSLPAHAPKLNASGDRKLAVSRAKPSSIAAVRQAVAAIIGEKAVSLSEGLGRLVITTSREIKVPGYPQMPAGALASLSNLANEPAFRQIIADGRAARKRAIEAIGDVGECAIVRHDKGEERWKMILRDASEPGKWRTQSFDARGFSGHVSFASQELAIEDAATSGYSVRDDGALDRIQDSPVFQRGLFVTDLLCLVNSRKITHIEGDRRLAAYDQMAQALHSIAESGAQAFIAAAGETIYLLSDRIPEGSEQAVFMHEIVHRHGRNVLGQTGWSRMNLTLKGWSAQPVGSVERLIHDRALARAKSAAGGSTELLEEEFFAYSVEEAVTMGVKPSAMAQPESAEKWLDTVVTSFERIVSDILNGQPARPMSAQQVVDLAYALAQIENPARMAQIMERMTPQQRQVLEGVVARTAAPPWYSQLVRQVRQQRQDAMPAKQWIQWLNAQTSKGVKPDEIQWSGAIEWLEMQEGRVTKASLLTYLESNGVQVQEVVRGVRAKVEFFVRPNGGVFELVGYQGGVVDSFSTQEEAQELREYYQETYGEGYVGTPPKYAQYTLQGGANYRELLLTLPATQVDMLQWKVIRRDVQVDSTYTTEAAAAARAEKIGGEIQAASVVLDTGYKSSHWGVDLNVLAHIRTNDRTDAQGRKVLFIEEMQSDWGQQGKKLGFGYKDKAPLTPEEDRELMALYELRASRSTEQTARMHALNNRLNASQGKSGIPTAPFVTSTDGWLNLALKRIVKMAVDGGCDKVAFISGEQSAERYSLEKQVRQVMASKNEDGTFQIFKRNSDGKNIDSGAFEASALKGVVGADLAVKIAAQVKPYEIYENVDLTVGGEGMKVFYDTIVPNAVNTLLKKVGGGRMVPVDINGVSKYPRSFPSQGAASEWADKNLGDHDYSVRGLSESEGTYGVFDEYDHKEVLGDSTLSQPGFEVTDTMRETARMGMPLFSLELTAAVAQYAEGTSPDLIAAQQQCADVVARTIGTEKWMKAPNGLATRLTQSQWVLVRTENFKRWFGDWEADPENASHAIDGVTREPMVMYHGAREGGFAEFNPKKRRRGMEPSLFFTSSRQVAATYCGTSSAAEIRETDHDEDGFELDDLDSEPGVYGVFLNIRKPHIEDFEGAQWDGTRPEQWIVINEDPEFNDLPASDKDGKQYFSWSEKALAQALADSMPGFVVAPAPDSCFTTNSTVTEAKRYGCDGALMYDVIDEGSFGGGGDISHVFAVFNANQVKSATDNVGTFDPDSWDIRHSLQVQDEFGTGQASFEAWSEGLPLVSAEPNLHLGGAAVFEAFHGTTHTDIHEFRRQGNKEGFLGEGPYFTTSAQDASINYAGFGPNLTERISTEAELIKDNPDDHGMREMLEEYYDAHATVVPFDGWDDEKTHDAWYQHGDEAARFAAIKAIKGDSDGFMMKVFVKLANPADTTDTCQFLTYKFGSESDLDDSGDVTESGTLIDWIMAARSVARGYDVDIENYVDALLDDRSDIDMKEVFSLTLKHIGEGYNGSGELVAAGAFFRDVAEEAGFDGVIMDADLHFGSGRRGFGNTRMPSMGGVDHGTLHIVPFSAEQVKSATGNNGQFDPQNPDIRFSVAQEPKLKKPVSGRRLPIEIKMSGRDSVIAKAGKKIVGSATAWLDSRDEFVIMDTEVRGAYRRRGVATSMYKAIEDSAGKQLKPAVSLSDDAFEFWKSYRPQAVAQDLRHWKGQLIGASVIKNGQPGKIIKASGGSATMEYNQAQANGTQCIILRGDLNEALAAAGSPTIDLENGLIDRGGRSVRDFKTRVLDLTYGTKGIKRIESDGMLAAVQNKTGRPIFIFNGNFGREQFKQAHAEATLAGIEFDKMYVMAQSATYSGRSISFDRLDSVLPYEPAAPVANDVRKIDQTATPEFKTWFKESKAVDADGNPLVVYHGTRRDFIAFDGDAPVANPWLLGNDNKNGFFFTTDPGHRSDSGPWSGASGYAGTAQRDGETVAPLGASLMPVYLSIQAPYFLTSDQYRKSGDRPEFKGEIEALGYDSVLVGDTPEDIKMMIAFNPTQIKSAIGNSGAFDVTKSDIRHSMPAEVVAKLASGALTIAQTSTPEFKTWFGDSRVVDAAGKPLVVYHGTDKDFDAFDVSKSSTGAAFGPGIYLTQNSENTNWKRGDGSNVMPVYVSMKNPLDLRSELTDENRAALSGVLGIEVGIVAPLLTMEKRFGSIGAAAKAAGFDGVLHYGPNGQPHILAFESTQIKSAIGNNGSFDATKPDIRHSMPAEPAAPELTTATAGFKAWFKKSKVVDAEGRPLLVYHGSPHSHRPAFGTSGNNVAEVRDGRPFFVTEDYKYAEDFARGGNIQPLYASIQNPVDLGDPSVVGGLLDVFNVDPHILRTRGPWDDATDGDIEDSAYFLLESPAVMAHLRESGFDGAEIPEDIEQGVTSFAIFDSAQIKSAQGNNGKFDHANPDIRHSMPAEVVATAPPDGGSLKNAQTSSLAFSNWFGKSRVIDDQGTPLVVYHGTTKSFTKFSEKLLGKKTGALDAQTGFFFAENPKAAEMFTWESGSPFDGHIMPVYLRLENPLVITDLVLDGANGTRVGRLMQQAKTNGHDGVIFEQSDMLGHKGRSYAIFNPDQVKSAIGNNGNYDRAKSDIRHSMPAEPLIPGVVTLTAKAFNEALKPCKDAIYHDLVSTADAGPFDGGCVAFAQALQRVIGGNVVVLTSAGDRADHAAVELDGVLYDFDGPLKPADFMARFSKNEYTSITGYRAPAPHDLPEAYRGAALEEAIAAKLRAALSAQPAPARQVPTTSPPQRAAIPQEHSAAFSRWFERSEVTTEHGNPKVMYHSTVAVFTTFKRSRNDVGIHFGTKGQAEDRFLFKMEKDPYGPSLNGVQHATMPVYLSIKRALRMVDVGVWNRENMISQMPDEFSLEERLSAQTIAQVRDLIKSHGYDGIVYKNTGETAGGAPLRAAKQRAWLDLYIESPDGKVSHSPEAKKAPLYVKYEQACQAWHEFRNKNAEDSWIAFSPDQIKSALSDSGAFNQAKKPTIRHNMAKPPKVDAAQPARLCP